MVPCRDATIAPGATTGVGVGVAYIQAAARLPSVWAATGPHLFFPRTPHRDFLAARAVGAAQMWTRSEGSDDCSDRCREEFQRHRATLAAMLTQTLDLVGGGPGAVRALRRHYKAALDVLGPLRRACPLVANVCVATSDNREFFTIIKAALGDDRRGRLIACTRSWPPTPSTATCQDSSRPLPREATCVSQSTRAASCSLAERRYTATTTARTPRPNGMGEEPRRRQRRGYQGTW